MRIAFFTGAYVNAGDFLISNRAKALLKWRFPNIELKSFMRNEKLDDKLDEINACDSIVFAGGPGWRPQMWPDQFPLINDLADIKPLLFGMGMGSYFPTLDYLRYHPSSKTVQLLRRFSADGFGLGCRDNFSKQMLVSWGFPDVVMTGCPAWYDLDKVENQSPNISPQGIKTLAISDPALPANYALALDLLRDLIPYIAPQRILFIRHRGLPKKAAGRQAPIDFMNFLNNLGAEVIDIAGSAEGLQKYNDCDLHVGFRLHAHLYCLSERIPSILLEEDSRGWGANDALGLPHFMCAMPGTIMRRINNVYERTTGRSILYHRKTGGITSEVKSYLEQELDNDFCSIRTAFQIQRDTLPIMANHIDRLAIFS